MVSPHLLLSMRPGCPHQSSATSYHRACGGASPMRGTRQPVPLALTPGRFPRVLSSMSPIAFDTLKLAQRLEAAGLPPKQAQDVAGALSETIGEAIVTREYLDLRLGGIRTALGTKVEGYGDKGETL